MEHVEIRHTERAHRAEQVPPTSSQSCRRFPDRIPATGRPSTSDATRVPTPRIIRALASAWSSGTRTWLAASRRQQSFAPNENTSLPSCSGAGLARASCSHRRRTSALESPADAEIVARQVRAVLAARGAGAADPAEARIVAGAVDEAVAEEAHADGLGHEFITPSAARTPPV